MRTILPVLFLAACGVEAPESAELLESELLASPLAPGERACVLKSRKARRVREVDPANGGKAKLKLRIDGVPDAAALAGLTRAELLYSAYDADLPRSDGWLKIGAAPRRAMPARPRLSERWRKFRVPVDPAALTPGATRVLFKARKRADAWFKIKNARLRLVGPDLQCAQDPPASPHDPEGPNVVRHRTPAGVAAFAALRPDFPTRGLMTILGGLERPFTSILLDFGPAFDAPGVQMLRRNGTPNPAHFEALDRFLTAYTEATPAAAVRTLQLYLVNGPGMRRGARNGYSLAFPQSLRDFDDAVRNHRPTRQRLQAYLERLTATLTPHADAVAFRLAVSLEDNLSASAAQALRRLAQDAQFPGPIGRNPCACAPGVDADLARVGAFHERHFHGAGAIRSLPAGLTHAGAGDTFSNDGWGWTVPDAAGRTVRDADVVAMARKSQQTRLMLNLWYDPLQGYPIPSRGQRDYRFDHRPQHLLSLLRQGLR